MPANGSGRIDPNALARNVQDWSGPIAAPKPQPQKAPPPPAGPTGFWGRISQVGIGKVNALNAYRAATAAPVRASDAIARRLPGGQNDLKAQQNAAQARAKDTQDIVALKRQGKISSSGAARLLGNTAVAADAESQQTGATIKSQSLASQSKQGAQVGKDILLATPRAVADVGKQAKKQAEYLAGPTRSERGQPGGSQLLKNQSAAAKNPEYIKASRGINNVPADATIQAQKMAAGGAKASQIRDYLTKQSQALKSQTVRGAVDLSQIVPAGAGAIKTAGNLDKIFRAGPQAFLDQIKTTRLTDAGREANAPKAIGVADNTSGTQPISVKTPIRPGVAQESTTTKIGVRTPQRMTDEQFHAEFNKLSKNYDKEVKQVQADVAANPKPSTPTAKLIKAAKPDQEPLDGYHHSSELINDHANMMKQIDDGARGGQKIRSSEGGYTRTSEHTPFYRDYFAENGRAPSKAAYVEQAKKELDSGKAPYGMSDTYKSLRGRETGKSTEPVTIPLRGDEGTGKISTRQAVAVRTIDTKYERQMNDLLDRYHSPELSPKVAPKQIAKETLKADKTTGGSSGISQAPRVKIAQDAKTGQLKTTPVKTDAGRTAGGLFMEGQQTGKPVSMAEARSRATAGGETVAGSALNQEARSVEAGVTKELEGKATYNAGSFKQEAENAVNLLDKDPEKARAIATGRLPGNSTIHEVAVRRALEARALKSGDVDTLRALAASSQHTITSEAGQRLGAEGYSTIHNSPVDIMKEVSETRAKALEKTGKTVDKAAAAASKEIAARTKVPSKNEWSIFVESIKC